MNGVPHTPIGIAPPGFAGIEQGHPRSIFVPMSMKPAITPGWDGLDKPLIAWLWVVGRLKPGVDSISAMATLASGETRDPSGSGRRFALRVVERS